MGERHAGGEAATPDWPGPVKAAPDFGELLKVLKRQRPARPVLAELFLNEPLYRLAAGTDAARFAGHPRCQTLTAIHAFRNLGYDYATVRASDFSFPQGEAETKSTGSLNEGALITDRRSFENYPWPDPYAFPPDRIAECGPLLPPGMKFIVIGPGGVLENAVRLMGYDNLCVAIYDDPQFAESVFAAVGARLVAYYAGAVEYESVGAIWANDDWGFKTQTMLAPPHMRRFAVPWHRKIAEIAHSAGKPVIMHSCGRLDEVMEDIVHVIGHDAKHSYEDAIEPVEQAYERLHDRIAVIGGLDVDFMCRREPRAVHGRARAILERSRARGGYALGTGNSVPEYMPVESYFAMIAAANRERDADWAAWARQWE